MSMTPALTAVPADLASVQMPTCPISINSDDNQSGDQSHASQISCPPELNDENDDTNTPESVKHESRPIHLGKVVVIRDTAFATLEALVMYLYTGEIVFASFGSEENRTSRRKSKAPMPDYTTMPKSSPKSIYRLAEKCDIPDLKNLAYSHICANLGECDIVEEIFSRSTSCYPEILDAEVQHLANFLQASSGLNAFIIAYKLDNKIRSYAEGEVPHASEAFIALFDVLSLKASKPEVAVVAPAISTRHSSPYWPTLKTALNKSMTTGTFLDLQYYVRSGSSSPTRPKPCSPIYFSSLMVNKWFSKIEECAPKWNTNTDEGDDISEADSDIEDEYPCSKSAQATADNVERTKLIPMHPIPENPEFCDDGQRLTAIFRVGTAPTWKALLFYVYTNDISFAQLNSQDPGTRIIRVREQHDKFPFQPKPCSPKSLYRLANQLGLVPLRDLAFEDIKGKLSATNIMTELFSKFTSSQPDVLEMEFKIWSEKYRTSEAQNIMIREYIRSMSDGQNPHRWTALKSVFRRIMVPDGFNFYSSLYCMAEKYTN